MSNAREDSYPRRHYRNPPVVEAVARLQFAESFSLSVTTPGLLYAALKNEYPREPTFQNAMAAELTSEEGSGANLQLKTGAQRIRFEKDDGHSLLMVGGNEISAHCLDRYEGWESLSGRLINAVGLLGDLAPPARFTKTGVRYINRVEIPETSFRFEDYLTIGFMGPPGFPPDVNSFFDRMESTYEDGESKIAFTWATVESQEDTSAFILDFDLTWSAAEGQSVDIAAASVKLGELKRKETAAFESLLQDKLRGMFDEIHE